jgi:hypothetical protein
MMKTFIGCILMLVVSVAVLAAEPAVPQSASPADASVYFIEPVDGAVVATTFTVKFGLKGMGIAPAGTDIPNTGHHHLLIDQTALPDMTLPLPATDQIKHFGKGQTEAEVTLPPGKHTLQLVFANYLHIPHTPPVVSKVITITVK